MVSSYRINTRRTESMIDDIYLGKLRMYWKKHAVFPGHGQTHRRRWLGLHLTCFRPCSAFDRRRDLDRLGGRIAPTKRFFARPVMGRVRAGLPEPASQEPPEVLTIDDYLIEDPNRTALVTVRGDSMKDAGLLDGDLVVVETNPATRPGDIVVAVVDGEMTVKTLRADRKGVFFLEPANPAFEPKGQKARSRLFVWSSSASDGAEDVSYDRSIAVNSSQQHALPCAGTTVALLKEADFDMTTSSIAAAIPSAPAPIWLGWPEHLAMLSATLGHANRGRASLPRSA